MGAKKKRAPRKAVPTPQTGSATPATAVAREDLAPLWPDSFRSLRQAGWVSLGLLAFSVAVLAVSSLNGLLWFKNLLALVVGVDRAALPLEAHSWDLGGLLVSSALLLAAAWVHPALGLGVVLLFRTFLDGYAYPTENLYFMVATGMLLVWWLLRVRRERGSVYLWRPMLLLALFFLVALAGSGSSIQAGNTREVLTLWASYLLLLVLTLNLARAPGAARWLLGALMLTAGLQALYSVLQYEFLLPYLRHLMMNSQEWRLAYFGTEELTPELIYRFNVNRAFGTMLHPNALAAFLILSLPVNVALAAQLLRQRRALCRMYAQAPFAQASPAQATAVAVSGWFLSVLLLYLCMQFRIAYALDARSWYEGDVVLAILVSVIAIAPAMALYVLAARRGLRYMFVTVGGALLPFLAALHLYVLIITYSRGAMVALVGAAIVLCVLLAARRQGWRFPGLRWAAPFLVAALLLSALAGLLKGLPAGAQEAGQTEAAPLVTRELITEGQTPTSEQLLNPASFRLRLTYWDVGWTMFRHHLWTGVGLGNFGIAYPRYQYVGAGDVKEAHNSPLQLFAETGVFGGLLFCAFWGCLVVWGAVRVLQADPGPRLWLLCGLYTGLLAFLLHAAIDIHFSQPSLAMMAMVFTGIFLAEAGAGGPVVSLRRARGAKGYAPALLAAAALAGVLISLFPLFLRDFGLSRGNFLNMASKQDRDSRLRTAAYFLDTVPQHARSAERDKPIQIGYHAARMFIPDPSALDSFGDVYAPLEGAQGYRKLPHLEEVPAEAVLLINRYWNAYGTALQYGQQRVEELERLDAWYPHDHELAMHISQWCELILRHCLEEKNEPIRQRMLGKLLYWGEESVRRSPMGADAHSIHANMLWTAVQVDLGPKRMPRVEASLRAFERAAQLNPSKPEFVRQYAQALHQLASTADTSLTQAEKAAYAARAREAWERATALQQQRWDAGLDHTH